MIVSIGNDSNPLITRTTPELEANKWGNILTNELGRTSMEKVYAGGDIVIGAATVIQAMGAGRGLVEAAAQGVQLPARARHEALDLLPAFLGRESP